MDSAIRTSIRLIEDDVRLGDPDAENTHDPSSPSGLERWQPSFAWPAFIRYCRAVAERFCSWVGPSSASSLLSISRCRIEAASLEELHVLLFWVFVERIERFRADRRAAGPAKGRLVTQNVVFDLVDFDGAGDDALAWPRWLVKVAYAGAGVVIGTFPRGEIEQSAFSEHQLPVPPCNFVSIRSTVPRHDAKLLRGASQARVLADLRDSEDDGGDVLAPFMPAGRSLQELDDAGIRELYARVKAHSVTYLSGA